MKLRIPILLAALLPACAPSTTGDGGVCAAPRQVAALAGEVDEASGLAFGGARPDLMWTHNDSGNEPMVFAIDTLGGVLGRVRVDGAENVDWEDLATGPCPAGSCLYIGDIGDNQAERGTVAIYRMPEPDPGAERSTAVERFPIRYPGGPRDAEALFVTGDGGVYVVTKGRNSPVAVYRYPAPMRPGEVVELEPVQVLDPGRPTLMAQVTGASAADGLVALRTYGGVRLYRMRDGRLEPVSGGAASLTDLAEPQGEGVALRADGTVLLISEAGPGPIPGTLSRLSCGIP